MSSPVASAAGWAILLLVLSPLASAADSVASYLDYRKVVKDTAAMVRDPQAQRLARASGLEVLDLVWEDTARFKGSSVGPNISDVTLQVQLMDPRDESFSLVCMPVIRHPNFSDRTADLPFDRVHLLVGNQSGRSLERITLRELLADPRRYLHDPGSWPRGERSLLAPRDSHVLASAQACFMPVPRRGRAEFNPVLFNYQSMPGHPAVLTILATSEGTSMTVIDNQRDGFQAGQAWGQRLFFNQDGRRASFTAERVSDVIAREAGRPDDSGRLAPPRRPDPSMSCMLLIQVPLKQDRPRGGPVPLFGDVEQADGGAPAGAKAERRQGSDVEDAVLGHGRVEGPYTEIDGLKIERDPRFPVRVTVQFYKATSNGVVSPRDLEAIDAQIERIYRDADYTGSLVTRGFTGRPTEPSPRDVAQEPPNWWGDFWTRYEKATHISREQALTLLRQARGDDWMPASEAELAAALGFED